MHFPKHKGKQANKDSLSGWATEQRAKKKKNQLEQGQINLLETGSIFLGVHGQNTLRSTQSILENT